MSDAPPQVLARCRDLVQPALRAAVDAFEDPLLRRISGYHLGWLDAEGAPVEGSGGKALRPALALLSAEAAGGTASDGVPAAVAVELVHNFSLLHDDIMDRDVERRHRPTGWVVFGDGPAILAGNAMLTAAIQVLSAATPGGHRGVERLLNSVQELIRGQSEDLALEGRSTVRLDEVLHMEAGKTAALLACASSIGAAVVGSSPEIVAGLAAMGHELGMAFQLIDDILGITGDAAVTGKSASSDVRAGKRSAPIVAALDSATPAGERLATLLADGPPKSEDDVRLATKLIEEAGGLAWAAGEADRRLAEALAYLHALELAPTPAAELAHLARYVVERDL
jgi:geranylgeranyl diphosphate synthase type I